MCDSSSQSLLGFVFLSFLSLTDSDTYWDPNFSNLQQSANLQKKTCQLLYCRYLGVLFPEPDVSYVHVSSMSSVLSSENVLVASSLPCE